MDKYEISYVSQGKIRNSVKNKRKQTTGIEPASSAWEADILPMYYVCL